MDGIVSAITDTLPRRRDLLSWTVTFCAYLLSAKLGHYIYESAPAPAFIWPPVGIALASIYLRGPRMWSAIMLASLVASASLLVAWPTLIGSALGNTIQPLVGAYVFRKFGFHPSIGRLRDTVTLLFVALAVTTIAPSIIVTITLLSGSGGADLEGLWRTIWSGGFLSVLIFTPLIVCWTQDPTSWRDRLFERIIALSATSLITYIVFWTDFVRVGSIPLVYFILVPLFWVGLRFRPRSVALALFLSATIAIAGTIARTVDPDDFISRIFNTELFLATISIIFLLFASVVEERRQIADELRRRIVQLQEALERIKKEDNAKSEFLAILAHELRNPLAPVLNTIELFRLKRARSAEDTEILEGAEKRLSAMGRLLDDLLDISRISERRLHLRREPVEVKPLLERSVETVSHLVEKYGHTISWHAPREITWINADPVRVEQIVVNLLTNAAKYTEPGGNISLVGVREGRRVAISVRDNGNGIPADMLDRIFEPFLQIPSKRGVSGVGIGLALARQLAEMHGGSLRAYSPGVGLGSTFTLTLPIVDAPDVSAAVAEPDTESPANLRILIVDDNQAGAEALSRLLTFKGHRTTIAFTGVQALKALQEDHPEVVLLDIGLPDMDGYEVARQMRLSESTAILIALTGYGQADDVAKAKAAGFDFHLTKPVGFADIERCLREGAARA